MKVFCEDCRYFQELQVGGWGGIAVWDYECFAEQNTNAKTWDSFRRVEVRKRRILKAKKLNKHNNCPWFVDEYAKIGHDR